MTSQTKSKWEQFAEYYLTVDLAPQAFLPPLLQAAGLDTRRQILEVGCGGCRHMALLRQVMGQGSRYTGIDISSPMIDQSLQRRKTLGLNQIMSFMVADGQQLSFADSSFDLVVANQVINHTAYPQRMAREIGRVLRKGGVLAASFWGDQSKCTYFTLLGRVFAQLGLTMPATKSSPFDFNQEKKVRQLFEDEGFRVNRLWRMQVPYSLTKPQDAQAYLQSQSMKKLIDGFGAQSSAKVKQLYKSKFREQLDSGQPFGFEAILTLATVD